VSEVQGGSNMTGTYAACLHTNQSRSYLNHLVHSDSSTQVYTPKSVTLLFFYEN